METTASKETVKQPPWHEPSEKDGFYAGLNVLNSLTNTKVKFIPSKGKRVGWYICGPTTYDSSHLGHARNYVTFDIIRRILEDYFGYEIFSVMNITDVDDKIIVKARCQYLFDKYKAEHATITEEVVKDIIEAWTAFIPSLEKKQKETTDVAEAKLLDEKLAEARKTAAKVKSDLEGMMSANNNSAPSSASVLDLSMDPLSILLDSRHGSTVKDRKIFRDLAAKYEDEFMEDMRNLNVKMPDVLTRVTEYIPEVIAYVEKIMENGYAYVADGSVYFDTIAFAKKHPYAKLEPWSVGNQKLVNEGEGKLSLAGKKKHPNDFALWKKSKDGEPQWESTWGIGRPGWHIECSAMASSLLGTPLDVHSGGEDLRFPHHDNELAQSEAYYDTAQWVNYFLHSGHLHIEGLKMSKSLKNFITIREALQKTSSRQLRLLFLSQPWNKVMNYAESTLEAIKSKEKTIKEFFLAIRAVLQEHQDLAAVGQHWDQNDIALHNTLLKVQDEVDAALKNNFDTPAALLALMDVISAANKYLRECPQTRKALLLRKIGLYITKILRIFGVVFEKDLYATATEEGQVDTDKILRPVTAALAQFRTSVRSAKSDPNQLLKLCDDLRDVTLPPLGIRIEDSGSNPFLFDNPQEIMKDIAERKAQADKIARQKLENKAKSLKSEIEDLEQGKLTPREVLEKEGYSDFDDQGLPNKQKDGKEVTASAKKNLKKTITGQEKLQKKYQDAIAKDPEVINAKKKELAEIEAKLN